MTSGEFWDKAWQYRIDEGKKHPTSISISSLYDYENGVRNAVIRCDMILMDAKKELDDILNKPVCRDGSKSKEILVKKWSEKWFGL